MDFFHVVPPFWLLVNLAQVLVQTALSQVLHDDVLAGNPIEVIFYMIGCAVFTIREALLILELLSAGRTPPCHKSWLNPDITCQLVSILIELFDEVQSSLVV